MTTRALTFEDYLPLRALYARFDAIAKGATPGNSTTAHQAVLDRLAANQRVAERLGWTDCVIDRQGGRGRLLACGVRPGGTDREVIPDWIPSRLRPPEHDALSASGGAHDPSSGGAAERRRYDELRATKAGWVQPASPTLTDGMFDRVAKRLAAAASKSSRDGTLPDPAPEAQ